MQDTIKIVSDRKPLMVAHRGVSGLETENTNSAFIAAGNRSYYGIETDVRPSRDGVYICFHDNNTQRIGYDNLIPEETSFETLMNLHLQPVEGQQPRNDIRIATMQDYIRICKHYGKTPVMEIKRHGMNEAQMTELCNIVAAEGYLDETIIIDFDLNNLIVARKLYPNLRLQYLIPKTVPDDLIETLNTYQLDLDIYHGALTKELADRVHAAGHKINVWTVDRPEDAQRVIDLGVDFITTNILE